MAISIKNTVKNICSSIGKNNNPAYVVVAIATAKGIFRPFFTMMDKKEAPETKKYAALREGLTEVIAIPTYLLCGAIAGKGAKLFTDPEKAKIAKHNLRFAGVCTAALLVIPGLCSVAIKPFTNMIFKKKNDDTVDNTKKLDIVSKDTMPVLKTDSLQKQNPVVKYPAGMVNMATFTNSGMKVG